MGLIIEKEYAFLDDRAVCVSQPWAGLLVQGAVDIIMRRRSTRFRGPVYIHASRGFSDQYYLHDNLHSLNPITMAARGGIVGHAEIVDTVFYRFQEQWDADISRHRLPSSEFRKGRRGWIFANAKTVPFRQMNGRPFFFRVPKE